MSAKKEPKGCLEYIRKVRKFLMYYSPDDVENIDFREITETDISGYMKTIRTTERNGKVVETSFSYRKQNHTILYGFFEYLCKKHIIDENPVENIDRETRKDHPNRKFLGEKELKAILECVDNGAGTELMKSQQRNWKERDKTIIMLLTQTGMREGALTEINVSDIDFDNQILKIIDKGHEEIEYGLSDEMAGQLQRWIEKRKEFINDPDFDALFISNRRKRMVPLSVAEIVEKYSKEAIGYKVSPHKLRRAYCNIMIRNTGNIHMVSRLVGHKRVDTTQIYIDDTTTADRREAANYISKLLA
jgi:site-specific recombinase XerD